MTEAYELECIKCKERYPKDEILYVCRRCGGLLDVKYDYSAVNVDEIERVACGEARAALRGVWRFHELLPFSEDVSPVSIGEGNTPLYRCERLGKKLGVELFVKHEGLNPVSYTHLTLPTKRIV